MKHALLLLIPTALLGGCWAFEDEEDDPREQYTFHVATSWVTTPGGTVRDAGPFGSVEAGYVKDIDINLAIDYGRAQFYSWFPEFWGANPPVNITDDYVFWVSNAGFASGLQENGQVYVALWSRIETVDEPGDCWIKRAPGEYFGVYYPNWRSTGLRLIPAYQHELLHYCIGDPLHRQTDYWARLK